MEEEQRGEQSELARLQRENAALLAANRLLEEENAALLSRLAQQLAGEEEKHDSLWPIRQRLMRPTGAPASPLLEEIRDGLEKSTEEYKNDDPKGKEEADEKSTTNTVVTTDDKTVEEPVLSPRSTQREKIISEIIETERRYVTDLTLLHHLFRNPLYSTMFEDDESVLTKSEFNAVFSNSETLLHLNGQFLSDLKDAPRDGFGKVFLQYAPMFKLYATFCAGLSRSFDTIKVLRTRPQSQAILKLIEKLPDLRQLPLESFLSLPMQRVLRYVLFLETLDKNTDPSHPDKANVQAALARLRVIATTVNESVAALDRQHHLVELKETLFECPFEVIAPFRKFVREGNLRKITSKFVLEDWYILLNDVLIYCSRWSPQHLLYKGHIDLRTAWVRDLPDSAHLQNILQLVAPQKTFTFYFETSDEKASWMTSLQNCISVLVEADPKLLEKRGRVKPRLPSSGFYAVLRKLFSYTPQDIEEEKEDPPDLDEFVLLGEDKPPGSVGVDAPPHKLVRLSEALKEEQQFNDNVYWKVD